MKVPGFIHFCCCCFLNRSLLEKMGHLLWLNKNFQYYNYRAVWAMSYQNLFYNLYNKIEFQRVVLTDFFHILQQLFFIIYKNWDTPFSYLFLKEISKVAKPQIQAVRFVCDWGLCLHGHKKRHVQCVLSWKKWELGCTTVQVIFAEFPLWVLRILQQNSLQRWHVYGAQPDKYWIKLTSKFMVLLPTWHFALGV